MDGQLLLEFCLWQYFCPKQFSDYLNKWCYKRKVCRSFFQLVFEAILSSARELGIEEDEDGNELVDVALIHVAHYRIQSRLRCFGRLALAQPSVVPRLKETLRAKESEMVGELRF